MTQEKMLEVNKWIDYAKMDLDVAKHLEECFHPKPLEIICYHCQQAAEKAVKALIFFYETEDAIPRTHDISLLLMKIKDSTPIAEEFYHYANSLTRYGVATRYPNELFLENTDANTAINQAGKIVQWAIDTLNSTIS